MSAVDGLARVGGKTFLLSTIVVKLIEEESVLLRAQGHTAIHLVGQICLVARYVGQLVIFDSLGIQSDCLLTHVGVPHRSDRHRLSCLGPLLCFSTTHVTLLKVRIHVGVSER